MHTVPTWEHLELLLSVHEAGSLSKAATQLRVTQPTVSRQLADLEAALGEQVFVRTVQGVHLTAFGERLLEPAKRMAEAAREAALVASHVQSKPEGRVRITAPPGLAWEIIVPFARRVRKALPGVVLDVVARVDYLDLGRREADLGLRIAGSGRKSQQRDLLTLCTVKQEVGIYAAPRYVAHLPRNAGLGDLDWIAWSPSHEHLAPNPQLAALIPGFRPIFTSDDYLVQVRAAEAGLGAIVLGDLHANRRTSSLVRLDIALGKRSVNVDLVCARSSLTIPRVRAVAEALQKEMLST